MIKRIFFITLCLIPVVALADPSTQRGKSKGQGPPFKKSATRPANSELEFDTALGFLEKVSPNRFKAYQSLDEDRRGIFRDRIVAFYRTNQWIDRDDSNEMRKLREKVIKAEDEVFSVRWDILASGGARRASDEDRARLRAAVGELVKLQTQERALRLEWWKKWVKSEEEQIAAMEANTEEYIEERYRDEMEGRGLGLFDSPRRSGGGPPGGKGPNEKPPREPKP